MEDLNGPPRVSMDYAYMEPKPGQFEVNEEIRGEVEEGESPEEAEVKKKGMPILVVKCSRTKVIFSTVVPKKGVCPFAVATLGRDLGDLLGYRRLKVRSDQEPSIKAEAKAELF